MTNILAKLRSNSTNSNCDIVNEETYARAPRAPGTAQENTLTHQVSNTIDNSNHNDVAKEDTNSDNAFNSIKEYRLKNSNKVILATLNINSIRNKFSSLKELVSNNIDVLVIEETKLDDTFPAKSFVIPGYKEPFRKDRNAYGGGIMVFIREDIPSRKLPTIDGFTDF